MWKGSGNNYAYIVTDSSTLASTVIDPANPPEVLPVLANLTSSGKIDLKFITNTHHHHDHAGGNSQILEKYPLPIIGGKDCEKVTKVPFHGEKLSLGKDISITALKTPCHTQDSVCFLFEDAATGEKAVFTGDTLFVGGCGRFFEGTAAEMDHALNTVLADLPDDTLVYPGHEYTKGNVKFAVSVSSSEKVKDLEKFADENEETQGKFTIGDEKRHNVFMMLGDEEVIKKTGKTERVDVMRKLREMKNAS